MLQNFKRMIIPLNDLVSWVIVGFGVITAAGLAGIDVRPILTFGGVSGIVVGLSAQSVLANMIAGINLVHLSGHDQSTACVLVSLSAVCRWRSRSSLQQQRIHDLSGRGGTC